MRLVNPYWVERIMDNKDYKTSRHYADGIPWRICDYSENRYASAGVQLGEKLYVIGGYSGGMAILPYIEEFDLETEKWGKKIPLPLEAAETHMALAADGDYLYLLSGQKGPTLHPSTRFSYSLDVKTGDWVQLPDVPEGRYAAAAAYYEGRIHMVGGGKEDRHSGASDHWSLEVENGKTVESSWREESLIPKSGVHRANCLAGDDWYLFGGQESETPPRPDDPSYSFVPGYSMETAFPESFKYSFKDGVWKPLSPMPFGVSHTDASVLQIAGKIHVLGGQLDQGDFDQEKIPVTDLIQVYDPSSDSWTSAGHLPFRIKLVVSAYYNGKIYFGTGQKDTSTEDAAAERFIGSMWSGPYT